MFREIRRKDRETTGERALEILESAQYGFLATSGGNGYPYAIAVNHVVIDGKIYFHCALGEGEKLDNIRADSRVCFSVVGGSEILQSIFSTAYDSAVAFGTAREVTEDEKSRILMKLIEKFAPDFAVKGEAYVTRSAAETGVYEIEIERITGKSRAKNNE